MAESTDKKFNAVRAAIVATLKQAAVGGQAFFDEFGPCGRADGSGPYAEFDGVTLDLDALANAAIEAYESVDHCE